MTRKKNSPQKNQKQQQQKSNQQTKRIRNSTLCHRVTEFDVRKPVQKHNYKATGGSGKNQKDSRDFMTAEFRSNQAEIKNQLNEMQSKLEVLTMRVNEVENE